jgi:lysophospholipase L1-like esterase
MKTLLCYGDSNTWGSATSARPDGRYGPEERWPGIARSALGPDWLVIEEGLSGRTTVHPDPIEGPWLDGAAYLHPCLRTHRPLDAVAIMLGTNDLKMRFSLPPGDIALGIGRLLTIVQNSESGRDGRAPQILVVCPARILDHHGERPDLVGMFEGGHEKSHQLPPLYEAVAREYGAAFLDAGALIESSGYDGIHLDAGAHRTLGQAIAEAVRGLGVR